MSNEIRECKKCINTTANPSITMFVETIQKNLIKKL